MGDILYKSIDKNMIKTPVAYCKAKKAYLSKKQMKVHRCVARKCMHLRHTNEKFWEERRRIKRAAKERKKNLLRSGGNNGERS